MSNDTRAAVVTGAGQGLGRAIAIALSATGRPVVVSDINEDLARETAREVVASGGRAIAEVSDVSSEEDVHSIVTAATDLGGIGVWVNNAGISRPAMLHKMSVDEFDTVVNVHVRGTFLGIREAARHMIEAKSGGVILNVASSAGLQGTMGQINYSAAKGAVVSMTKSAARELARYNIRVNAVAPVAATPMTEKLRTAPSLSDRFLKTIPLGRIADTDEIAETFVFLASGSSGYMTGQVICVDGGLYMAS